ncbi:interleukin-15-like isoform X1 [Notolabrus celidotus]|uniref:interleukin-15-like isoform X1 n=1 Tax=Notolabrus celidotus TaxID=1203425 RepID=UPI0014901B5F|nr:interleukin-15-like isoform X1 [Notolabrus celidotus]
MTGFMTAPPVILVNPTYPGDPHTKCIQIQLACNLCPDSHKTQVWLCFFILSFLSTCTCAVSSKDIEHFNICLDHLKSSIQKSDAMLYAPSTNDVKPACVNMSLNCYMLELKMVIDEEDVWNNYTQCINEFALSLSSSANAVGCPPCEAYSPQNITIFLERLNTLLQRFTVLL